MTSWIVILPLAVCITQMVLVYRSTIFVATTSRHDYTGKIHSSVSKGMLLLGTYGFISGMLVFKLLSGLG